MPRLMSPQPGVICSSGRSANLYRDQRRYDLSVAPLSATITSSVSVIMPTFSGQEWPPEQLAALKWFMRKVSGGLELEDRLRGLLDRGRHREAYT
jgi:hypothetical protein